MNQRIFHGDLSPQEIGDTLISSFNRGNFIARQVSSGSRQIVQIVSHPHSSSGGATSLTVILDKVEDGVAVQIGNQAMLGVAASLGSSLLSIWRNPFNLIDRLDDIAQDFDSIQLSDQVEECIEDYARLQGASFELSERLRRMMCEYCLTANPVGEPACIACGAPLGKVQPRTCLNCGFVVQSSETVCPQCGKLLPGATSEPAT
jgi:RNase P subunit RPR2